ncbi:hypothetical protein E2562_013329 [Oryza meyeriana var. granulata]|uniref:Uncharacterized protein n=1 Tax=Oryza meyeriana var. granulata TaxID=110450 RepID=A0A6G1D234_9ORYZ|nr:hypothetical protein E2562_013329 [Oryza meyeriana var. granulata]
MASREAAAPRPRPAAGKASTPSGHHAGARGGGGDLWSEILASGGGAAHIGVVYARRRAQEASSRRDVDVRGIAARENRPSFVPSKRTSWNRSLSIRRGRVSVLNFPKENLWGAS